MLGFSSFQFSYSCLNLCNPMDYSTPVFPIHLQLPKLAQTHLHRVSDATQPSHPLSFPPPPFNLSQNQGLFQWVSSLHQVVKVLEFQLHHQSFQWIFRTDCLSNWLVWSPCCLGDSWESAPAPQGSLPGCNPRSHHGIAKNRMRVSDWTTISKS